MQSVAGIARKKANAGGGGFDPLTLSPTLWLDASDASTLYDATSGGSLVAASGTIARWEDKSGNALHLTQATSGARPVRETSVQNGLDGVFFGSASVNSIFAASVDVSAWTFWSVVIQRTGNSSFARWLVQESLTNLLIQCYDDPTNRIMYANSDNWWVNGTGPFASGDASDLVASRLDDPRIYEFTGVDATTASQFTVGSTAAGNNPFKGHVLEIIAISGTPTSGQRADVNAYLADKWGITI